MKPNAIVVIRISPLEGAARNVDYHLVAWFFPPCGRSIRLGEVDVITEPKVDYVLRIPMASYQQMKHIMKLLPKGGGTVRY